MNVVAVLLDVLVNEGVNGLAAARVAVFFVADGVVVVDAEVLAALPLDAGALDHMPKVRDDAHLGKELAVLVEINTPRITSALGEDLEDMACGMITPDTRIHPLPLVLGRARLAD